MQLDNTRKVNGVGPLDARIMIIGETPGHDEVVRGEPFVGSSGVELTKMLHESGLIRSECYFTYLFKSRILDRESLFPAKKASVTTSHVYVNGKAVLPRAAEAIADLSAEIARVKPNVIIALGETALWALTSRSGITKWRGSELVCEVPGWRCNLIPTIEPSIVNRQWEWRALAINDMRRALKCSATPEPHTPSHRFLIRPSFEAAVEHLTFITSQLAKGPFRLSVDIETRHEHIACIGFAWSSTEAVCIPLMCIESDEGYWLEEQELHLINMMKGILTHPNVEVIGQNFAYDAQYILRYWKCAPLLHHDTMLKQHVLFAGMQKSLDFLSSLFCEHHVYWKDDGKLWDPKVPEEQLWAYNCVDCVRTYEIDTVLTSSLEEAGLTSVYDFQVRLWYAVLAMMQRGVAIDQKNRATFAAELFSAIADREQRIIDMLGHPINVRSSKQMQTLFYEDLGLPKQINRKTGAPSLDDKAMQKLCAKEPLIRPLVTLISDIRSLGVFLSTFVQAPLDTDQRMRCSFNLAGTETYRFASSANPFNSGTNLQNIPKGNEDPKPGELSLPNVRKLFLPDPHNTIFDIDLDRADLQVVVWEADDADLKRQMRRGVDLHIVNGILVFGGALPPEDELIPSHPNFPEHAARYKRERQFAKAFIHGTNYGGGARTMAMTCNITTHQADLYQRRWFSIHPGIRDWHRRTEDSLTHRREVRNPFGYRRFFFERIDGLLPEALAWIPQSTVACVINRALLNLAVNVPQVELMLQVHDSLVGQYRTVYEKTVLPSVHENMLITIPYPDPLIIPCGIKTSRVSWGAVEEAKWPE